MAIIKSLKNIAKVLIKGINSTDKINTINHKTEMFIEENGEKVLIRFIEFERGKHSEKTPPAHIKTKNFENFTVVNDGEVEYKTTHNDKRYILKRVGSKQLSTN